LRPKRKKSQQRKKWKKRSRTSNRRKAHMMMPHKKLHRKRNQLKTTPKWRMSKKNPQRPKSLRLKRTLTLQKTRNEKTFRHQ